MLKVAMRAVRIFFSDNWSRHDGRNFPCGGSLEPIGQHPQTEQPTVTIQPRPRLPTQHKDFPDATLAGIAGSNRNALKMLFGRGYRAWV
jgi:hypothetical protein